MSVPSLQEALHRIDCSVETLAAEAGCAVDSLRRFRRLGTWPCQHRKLRDLLRALIRHQGLSAEEARVIQREALGSVITTTTNRVGIWSVSWRCGVGSGNLRMYGTPDECRAAMRRFWPQTGDANDNRIEIEVRPCARTLSEDDVVVGAQHILAIPLPRPMMSVTPLPVLTLPVPAPTPPAPMPSPASGVAGLSDDQVNNTIAHAVFGGAMLGLLAVPAIVGDEAMPAALNPTDSVTACGTPAQGGP